MQSPTLVETPTFLASCDMRSYGQQAVYAPHHKWSHGVEANNLQKHAESMFKVDFFEFYTLLERYISVSLAIMGVHVSGTVPRTNVNALKYITNPELRNSRPQALHAFHANLLQALDAKDCPLHASLGTQEVRIQLGLAKDYRNAWKDADEETAKTNGHSRDRSPSKNVALRDFDLDTMLRMLLTGCEHAHVTVQARPETDSNSLTAEDFEQQSYYDQYSSMDMDDIPFEYIDDAMDLD